MKVPSKRELQANVLECQAALKDIATSTNDKFVLETANSALRRDNKQRFLKEAEDFDWSTWLYG